MKVSACCLTTIFILLLAGPALAQTPVSKIFAIQTITDTNGDGSATVGEILSLNGKGFTSGPAGVIVMDPYGQSRTATIVTLTPTRMDIVVPGGLEGNPIKLIMTVGQERMTLAYPFARRLVLVTDNRSRAIQLLASDTLQPLLAPIDFNALGILDGDGAATAPFDVVVNNRGNLAYIFMTRRIYVMDLIAGTLATSNPIDFTAGTAARAFLTPMENYFLTLSPLSFFFSNVSRIGPLPAGTTSSLPLFLLDDLAISPDSMQAFLLYNFQRLARLSVSPSLAVLDDIQVGSGNSISQLALSANGSLLYVGEGQSGNDQILVYNAADLSPVLPPLPVPGEIHDLAITQNATEKILVADCLNNQVYQLSLTGALLGVLSVNDCPQSLKLPDSGRTAYIRRVGSPFVPQSFISRWDLSANQLTAEYHENVSTIRGFAVQK